MKLPLFCPLLVSLQHSLLPSPVYSRFCSFTLSAFSSQCWTKIQHTRTDYLDILVFILYNSKTGQKLFIIKVYKPSQHPIRPNFSLTHPLMIPFCPLNFCLIFFLIRVKLAFLFIIQFFLSFTSQPSLSLSVSLFSPRPSPALLLGNPLYDLLLLTSCHMTSGWFRGKI